MIRVAVYGASGYGGLEACRLLLSHPKVDLVQVTSRSPGRRLDEVHPSLRGLTNLVLSGSEPGELDPNLDAVLLALPHGESKSAVPAIEARCPKARLIDLAQDFRVGAEGWRYGLADIFRDGLEGAQKVACPGCFATSILLATLPALKAGLRPRQIIADSKTGSSGSGATPAALTHHPIRASTHKAYKVFKHQHEAEIKAAWAAVAPGASLPHFAFVPQSSPLVRGIYSCCYLVFDSPQEAEKVAQATQDAYADSPFVTVLAEPPNVIDVRGTNRAELYVDVSGPTALVIASIDNLVRGAAGQAVQCLNLAFDFAEDEGLRLAAWSP